MAPQPPAPEVSLFVLDFNVLWLLLLPTQSAPGHHNEEGRYASHVSPPHGCPVRLPLGLPGRERENGRKGRNGWSAEQLLHRFSCLIFVYMYFVVQTLLLCHIFFYVSIYRQHKHNTHTQTHRKTETPIVSPNHICFNGGL